MGWTRAEAADRLGVEPFTLQRVEEGLESPPDPRKMARVYAGAPDGAGGGGEHGGLGLAGLWTDLVSR